MDRSRFSTHKRPAFLLAGVLLVLLGILGAWHVLSRQAQWTVLDQSALENAGDAHLRSLSQQAEQCAGAHDFLWTGEPVELTNRLSSEAHAFLPVCAISPAYVPDAYPTNAQGLTYGSYADRTMYGYAPELVSVQGDEGNSGYVHLNEFRTAKTGDSLTVYDLDGKPIDTFSCTAGEVSEDQLAQIAQMER